MENFHSTDCRLHPRKPVLIPVQYATTDRMYQEFINDISAGGAFIETRQPLSVGQRMAMTFSLPNHQSQFQLEGFVVRIDAKGIGVEFRLADDEQAALLSDCVQRL